MAERKFAIRFSVEDMEKVRTALKGMGSDGASALTAIDRASRGVSPQLKAVDVAARDVRDTFDDFARRIPVIGGALTTLGPIGTAVAASFAGIGFGIAAAARSTRQAIDDIGRLKDAADNAGLGVEDYQAVRGAALLEGIGQESVDSMLSSLAINSARSSEGFGRMEAALKKVNPELALHLQLSSSQAQRLDILAEAVQGAASYNEKLNIAVAAFGTEGKQMIRVLDESGASLDTWRERAVAAGLVIDEQLVEAVDKVGKRLDILRAQSQVAGQRLAVAAAPILEEYEKLLISVQVGAALLIDEQKPLADRQLYTLLVEGNRLEQLIAEGKDMFDVYKHEMQDIAREILRRYAAGEKNPDDLAADSLREAAYAANDMFNEEQRVARQAQRKRDAEAAKVAEREAEEAARLRAQQEKEAIEIRAQLGDWTGKLAAEEERLNKIVAANVGLTGDQAKEALARYRAELDGTAAAAERWKQMLQAAETPIERAERALAAFDAEVAKFGDLVGVNEDAVRVGLVGTLEEARRAAKEATPAMRAVVEARALIARHAESMMTDEQKVAAKAMEWKALAAAFEQTGFSAEEAAKAVAAYRAELERTTDAQKESTFEIRFASEVMGEILDENMNSLEDLGRVALRVFRSIALEWILTNQKMAKDQGFFEFVGNAFASAFGGGSASGTTQTVTPDTSVGGGWGVFHSGGVIGSTPVQTRWTNSSIFAGAPRLHGGGELRAGERAIIAEDGERMLSRVDNARIVRAIEGGSGGAANVELHFHGVEERPEVRQSRTPDGGLRIDVMMRNAALQALGSREGAAVMKSHYGIERAVRV